MKVKNRNKKHESDTRQIAQVSSKSLIPPEELDEATEADVDFAKEEKELAAAMKDLKARQAKLNKRKRVAVGGKKLAKMRTFAKAATEWAKSAADKAIVSVTRANDAVAKLIEYEAKLDLPDKQRVGNKMAEGLVLLTEAVEVLNAAKS